MDAMPAHSDVKTTEKDKKVITDNQVTCLGYTDLVSRLGVEVKRHDRHASAAHVLLRSRVRIGRDRVLLPYILLRVIGHHRRAPLLRGGIHSDLLP